MAAQRRRGRGPARRNRNGRPTDTETERFAPVPDPDRTEYINVGLTDDPADGGRPPTDMAAVYADDALLDAIGGANPFANPAESELGVLLAAWRRDVDAEPMPELIDTATAVQHITRALPRASRRPRYLVPLASAAAVLAIVFAGVGLAARDAQPGDALWSLTQVLYADHARSVAAAAAVRTELSHASVALQQGHFSAARNALNLAQAALPSVSSSDGQADLAAQQQNLLSQLNASTGANQPSSTATDGSSPASAASAPGSTTVPTTSSSAPTTTTQPTTSTSNPPSTTTDAPTTTSTHHEPTDDTQTRATQQPGTS